MGGRGVKKIIRGGVNIREAQIDIKNIIKHGKTEERKGRGRCRLSTGGE